jgi:aryl-alcohol dehydrogenase-like predicted oxidoreductase
METRQIGSLEVTVVGLGCNNFGSRIDADKSSAVVDAAIEAGINFFDTADIYGGTHSEEFLGRALKGRREQVLIATKFGKPVDAHRYGAQPEYVRQACEDSLRRMGTDYIDLYQQHEPDHKTPIEETLAALGELIREGKVREIGCSNFSIKDLRAAEAAAPKVGVRFVSIQNEYSLIHREPEVEIIPECKRVGIAFIPYFPLASGLLTGKYRRGQAPPEGSRLQSGWASGLLTEKNLDRVEQLIEFAKSRGHTILELAVSWLAGQPTVASVIAGATSPEQVRANATAANWRLSDTELAEIGRIVSG